MLVVAVVDAVHMAMTSKVVELTPVNEYQAAELEKHDITERDPKYVRDDGDYAWCASKSIHLNNILLPGVC